MFKKIAAVVPALICLSLMLSLDAGSKRILHAAGVQDTTEQDTLVSDSIYYEDDFDFDSTGVDTGSFDFLDDSDPEPPDGRAD